MPEYAWVCLEKQDYEYALGPKHAKFWIWQGSHFALHSIEYATICLDRVLNIFWGFLTCQNSEFDRVLNMQEVHRVINMLQYGLKCLNKMRICLNLSEFIIRDWVLNMYHIMHNEIMCTYRWVLMSTER